jgi:alanyl aminopeptidase
VTDDLRDPFAQYVRETLGPVLDHIGIEPRESEPETASMLRPRLLAWLGDTGQDAAVRDHCKKLAAQYIDDTSAIDPSLAGAALRVAMIDGTAEDFETCRKMAENTKVPTERSRFLRALGAFGDPALQDEALKYVLSGEVRPTETFTVVGGISHTDEGSAKVFQWMMDNYELITSRIPEAYAAYMPYFVSGCSEERLAVARKFFADPKHSVDGTEANLNKVSDSVMDCVNLREREGARVADYLGKMAAR